MKLYDFLKKVQRAKNGLPLSREEVARAAIYYKRTNNDKDKLDCVLKGMAASFFFCGRI
jgi:hypothetical protein